MVSKEQRVTAIVVNMSICSNRQQVLMANATSQRCGRHLPNIRTHAVSYANPAVRNQITITVRLDWKVSRIPKHMLKRTAWRIASAATKEAFSMAHKRGEMEWVPTMTLLHQRMFKVPLWSCHVQSKGYSDDVSRRGTFSNFEARSPRAVTDTAFLTAFASSKVMALITNVEPVIHRGWRLTVNKTKKWKIVESSTPVIT